MPPPRRRPLRGALRDEAAQLAALLERRRAASATYLLEQHQSSNAAPFNIETKPMQSVARGWLKTQGPVLPRTRRAQQVFSRLAVPRGRPVPIRVGLAVPRGGRVGRRVASNLFDRFATAVLVVEFYLTDDLPRVMEPPVAVDP